MATGATNTTENLGLSQWVASDFVLREDFNSDNAAIDAGFAELETSISGLTASVNTKASASALTAHEESSAAHSALLADKASVSALNAETAARQGGDCYEKLFDITSSAFASQVDLNFSSIDKSKYAGFKIIAGVPNDYSGFYVRINGNSDSNYVSSGVYSSSAASGIARGLKSYLALRYGAGSEGQSYPSISDIGIYFQSGRILGISRTTGYDNTGIFGGVAAAAYAPAQLSSINFVGEFAAGSTFRVYGLKV